MKKLQQIFLTLISSIIHFISTVDIDESVSGYNLEVKVGNFDYGSTQTEWKKVPGTTFKFCDSPAKQISGSAVVAFWFRTNSVAFNIGTDSASASDGEIVAPVSSYFKVAVPGGACRQIADINWHFAYFELKDICQGSNLPTIIYLRPSEDASATGCSGVDNPLEMFDNLNELGQAWNGKTERKFDRKNTDIEIRRLVISKKIGASKNYGIETLMYFFGFPEMIDYVFWTMISEPGIIDGLPILGGSQELVLERLTPKGVIMLPDSGDFVVFKPSAKGANDAMESFGFFNDYVIFLNNQGAENDLKGNTLSLFFVVNVKTTAEVTDVTDFEYKYTLRIQLNFQQDLSLKITYSMKAEQNGATQSFEDVVFPGGYNQITPSSILADATRNQIPISFQILFLDTSTVMLKMKFYGSNLAQPLSSTKTFTIPTPFRKKDIYSSMFTFFNFGNPALIPTLRNSVRLLLRKTNSIKGGYLSDFNGSNTMNCMAPFGTAGFQVCLSCMEGTYDTKVGTILDTQNYPVCSPCSDMGTQFIDCGACTNSMRCYEAKQSQEYYAEPEVMASTMIMKKNQMEVFNCNEDKNYNFFVYFKEGEPVDIDLGTCLLCTDNTCFCNKYQVEKTNTGANKKYCDCQIENCISCPIGQILNNKMVPCTQCADPRKLTIEDFTTMDVTCKTMTELEVGYGVVNEFVYSKCQTQNCGNCLQNYQTCVTCKNGFKLDGTECKQDSTTTIPQTSNNSGTTKLEDTPELIILRKSFQYSDKQINLEFNFQIEASQDLKYTINDEQLNDYSVGKFSIDKSTLKLDIKFDSSVSDLSLYVKFENPEIIKATKNSTNTYKNKNVIKVEKVYFINEIKAQDYKRAESISTTTSNLNTFLGYAATGMSFISLIMSADATGTLIKMAQIMKLVNRLRFINVVYGGLLNEFLNNIGDIFNEGTAKCTGEMSCQLKRKNKKFEEANQPLCFTCYMLVKSILYGVSFLILRSMEIIGIKKSINKSQIQDKIKNKKDFEISLIKVRIWRIAQKIHIILFNVIIIDTVFYATRRITQSNLKTQGDNIDFMIAFSILSFVFYDYASVGIRAASRFEPLYKLRDIQSFFNENKSEKDLDLINPNESSTALQQQNLETKWVVDYDLTLFACELNIPIYQFLESGLKQELKMTKNEENNKKRIDSEIRFMDYDSRVKFSNFIFLTKMILYQTMIASLQHSSSLITGTLIIVEIVDIFNNVTLYCKRRHYSGWVIFFQKNLQIMCLIFFLWIIYTISLKADEEDYIPVSKQKQFSAIYLIFVALLLEYLFLFFTIITKAWDFFFRKDKKIVDIKNEIHILKSVEKETPINNVNNFTNRAINTIRPAEQVERIKKISNRGDRNNLKKAKLENSKGENKIDILNDEEIEEQPPKNENFNDTKPIHLFSLGGQNNIEKFMRKKFKHNLLDFGNIE